MSFMSNHSTISPKLDAIVREVASSGGDVQALGRTLMATESLRNEINAVREFEDQFYGPFGASYDTKGITLTDLRDLIEYTEKQVKTSAILGRGLRLKTNHVLGRGYTIESTEGKVTPRHRAIMDDPDNYEAVFSPTAMKKLNRIAFTSGNILIMYNSKTKKFSRLSLASAIDGAILDANDPERVKYYLHKVVTQDDIQGIEEVGYEWVPTSVHKQSGAKIPKLVRGSSVGESYPVSRDCVVIDLRLNNDSGETWGVPDSLAALPWSWAYSEYLKDGSKLLKALASIAYQVKAKTAAEQRVAGAILSNAPAGGAAITGLDTEIKEIPRSSAVDLYTGRPIVANAASALDVSVTALTSDTGKGGSNASETTLSLPEQLSALSRQEDFKGLFRRIFEAMGAKNLELNFNRLAVDPIHRQMQSLGLGRTFGGLSQKEYRTAALELLDISGNPGSMPKPDEWTGSKYSTLASVIEDGLEREEKNAVRAEKQAERQAKADAEQDPNARQGNSGAVGSVTDDNELRDSDKTA